MENQVLPNENLILQQAPPSFFEYWLAVKRRRRMVLIIAMTVVTVTAAVVWLRPYQYTASARVQLKAAASPDAEAARNERLTNQVLAESLLSRRTLDAVIDRLDLRQRWASESGLLSQSAAVKQLRDKLSLSRRSDGALIDVAATDMDEATALLLARTVTEVFVSQRTQDLLDARQVIVNGFSSELAAEKTKLQTARDQVTRGKNELNRIIGNGRGDDASLAQLQQQIKQLRLDTLVHNIQLLGLEKLAENHLCGTFAVLANDPDLHQLLQQAMNFQQQQADVIARYGANHPEFARASAKSVSLQEQIENRMGQRLAAFQAEHGMEQARLENLTAQVADWKRLAVAESKVRIALAAAEHEEAYQLKTCDNLVSRLQDQSLNMQPVKPLAVVVDAGEIIHQPFGIILLTTVGAALGVGLCLGIAAALLLDRMDHSFKHLSDIETRLRLPVLGVVGLLKPSATAEAMTAQKEAYRLLRNQIECTRADHPFTSLCLVSAGAGEGKSSTVANLASVWVELGLRVLVVDTDFRRPSLHRLLGAANDVGLTDYLSANTGIETIVQSTRIPGVSLIAAGGVHGEPTITAPRMRQLVALAGRKFDLVLYDTPAAMQVSDSIIVAREVGTCLFVVQHHGYAKQMARRAVQMIQRTNARFVGVMVNKVHEDEQNLFFGNYSDYYYARPPGSTLPGPVAVAERRNAA